MRTIISPSFRHFGRISILCAALFVGCSYVPAANGPPPIAKHAAKKSTPDVITPTPTTHMTTLEEVIAHTQQLDNYAIELTVYVTVVREDGSEQTGTIKEFSGSFQGQDATYRISGTTFRTVDAGFPLGSLHIIRAGGVTYAKGPLPLPGAVDSVWYTMGDETRTVEPVYDMTTALNLLAHINLTAFRPNGTTAIDDISCTDYHGDEASGIALVNQLYQLTRSNNPLIAPIDHLRASGATLDEASAVLTVCDDTLHQISATTGYTPEGTSSPPVHFAVDITINTPATPLAIDAPFDVVPLPTRDTDETASIRAQWDTRAVPSCAEETIPAGVQKPNAAAAQAIGKGIAAAEAGDAEQATAAFTESLEADPTAAEAHVRRGKLLLEAGDYPEALDDFDQAIALASRYAIAYQYRGLARQLTANSQGALDDYTQVLRLNPRDPCAFFGRGTVYGVELDAWLRAVDDYTAAITLDPLEPRYYCNRGAAYQKLGEYALAERDCTTAIRLDPEYADAYASRALTREQIGNTVGAIADYEQAADLYSNAGMTAAAADANKRAKALAE